MATLTIELDADERVEITVQLTQLVEDIEPDPKEPDEE